ncbi:HepT-like ribonuclease domain-containing protein [Shinella oryzae]|uniref:DUF86 domain-containing protein n=1 Tax=Shinella oryzae TaxID=2871820 RepID=A0ABY9KA37_9HYPH|nr:HepT-like ribonuclease domain-containing protein [Shinella oryzae]WLS04514.1 DUF86 domain-containing protein [Shinella oryzae]
MPSERPLVRLRDIRDNIERIQDHIRGLDLSGFLASTITIDAVERCLSRISEAATKIGPVAEEILPEHDWRGIRGIGNRLRHEYDVITDPANWAIATQRLPELHEAISAVLERYPDDQEDF